MVISKTMGRRIPPGRPKRSHRLATLTLKVASSGNTRKYPGKGEPRVIAQAQMRHICSKICGREGWVTLREYFGVVTNWFTKLMALLIDQASRTATTYSRLHLLGLTFALFLLPSAS